MVDLEQSEARISNTWCMIFTFSILASFYLAKAELQNPEQSSRTIALSKGTIFAFCQKMLIF